MWKYITMGEIERKREGGRGAGEAEWFMSFGEGQIKYTKVVRNRLMQEACFLPRAVLKSNLQLLPRFMYGCLILYQLWSAVTSVVSVDTGAHMKHILKYK